MRPIILTAVFLLLGAGPLFAQPGLEAGAWKKMNLSDSQINTLKEIRSTTQKQMIDLRSALQKKRIDIRTVAETDDPDRSAFERLTREIADLQAQQKMLLFDADRAMSKNLNDDQLKIWKQIKQKRMARVMSGTQDRGERMRGGRGAMREDRGAMREDRGAMREGRGAMREGRPRLRGGQMEEIPIEDE